MWILSVTFGDNSTSYQYRLDPINNVTAKNISRLCKGTCFGFWVFNAIADFLAIKG